MISTDVLIVGVILSLILAVSALWVNDNGSLA
jgi:hypothetical protein